MLWDYTWPRERGVRAHATERRIMHSRETELSTLTWEGHGRMLWDRAFPDVALSTRAGGSCPADALSPAGRGDQHTDQHGQLGLVARCVASSSSQPASSPAAPAAAALYLDTPPQGTGCASSCELTQPLTEHIPMCLMHAVCMGEGRALVRTSAAISPVLM